MLPSRRRKRMMAEINIVPYIDVMLVLLVIFMITTPLLSQGVKVNLPKTQAKAIDTHQQKPIILTVNKKGQYFLNISADDKKTISPQQLRHLVAAHLAMLKREKKTALVLVKGDKEVDYGKVIQAMALLQNAGAKQIGLITAPGDKVEHLPRS